MVREFFDQDFRADQIPIAQRLQERGSEAGAVGVDMLTGDLLEKADTVGVFQCESSGARLTQRKLKTRTIFDLAVANAFFKPAPALGGMAQEFVLRYRGEEPTPRLHPILEPILGQTKGVILFQEQVLRLAREAARLSWAEAHTLRRGGLTREEQNRLRDRFVAGCQRRVAETGDEGLTQPQAIALWEQVTAFAGFSLNQGHASAYADLSYRMAYVKARWPPAFLCARLADWGGFHHQAIYIAEAQRLGIRVNPPHINHSGRKFTLEVASGDESARHEGADTSTLWMGLGQVRDLRRVSLSRIIEERTKQPFHSVRDLMQRVALQKKEIEHLIQCGALDGLGDSRSSLLTEADAIHVAGSAAQLSFSFSEPSVPSETPAQRVAWERFVLGQPISVHPLALVAESLPKHTPLRSLPKRQLSAVTVAGVRLPGWTGGKGFFLGDGETYITAEENDAALPLIWQPLLLRGQWRSDRWGTFWLHVESMVPME
jgi:DNA polymerase III alpha subunit